MKQHLMTRAEFESFVTGAGVRVVVAPPYELAPCACRDVNCHGWRYVPTRNELTYVADDTERPSAAIAHWSTP